MKNTNTLKTLALVAVIIMLNSIKVHASELHVAFGQHRPPFVFHENGQWKGIEIDIVRAALAFKGHSFSDEIHLNNQDLEQAITRMGFDAAVSVQKQDDDTYYSDSFITYTNVAISRQSDNISIDNIEDLSRVSAVAWQHAYRSLGASYLKLFGPEADSAHLLNYSEFADQEKQNAFFWLGRANVIIVDKMLFQWFRKKLSSRYDTSAEVVYHNVFPQQTHFQVSFANPQVRDDFNLGLKHLKDSGQYQTIIDNYIR